MLVRLLYSETQTVELNLGLLLDGCVLRCIKKCYAALNKRLQGPEDGIGIATCCSLSTSA